MMFLYQPETVWLAFGFVRSMYNINSTQQFRIKDTEQFEWISLYKTWWTIQQQNSSDQTTTDSTQRVSTGQTYVDAITEQSDSVNPCNVLKTNK